MEAPSSPARVVRRRVRALWAAVGGVPALLAAAEGVGHKTLGAVAAWALGALLAELALRRDPAATALAAVRLRAGGLRRVVGVALGLGAVALLLFPTRLVLFAALLAAVALVGLWAVCGPGHRFARWTQRGASAVAGLALLAAAGEVVCRLPPVVARTGGHRPGILRWEAAHYDRLWQRHPLGLRSRHPGGPKPAGVREILALGDNATFGVLVARTEDTWPSVLEDELTREGVAVQVVNAGQIGFTTANEAEWLARRADAFAPDLVVVQYGLNDAVPSTPDFGAERSFWFHRLRPLLPGLHPYLEPRSYLYSALDSFKEHQEMRWLHPEGYRPLYEDGMEGWQQAQRALAEIAAWAQARGARTLLVIFPDLEPDTRLAPGAYRYQAVHTKVRRAAEDAGFAVLDLFPAFAATGRPPESWWTLPCEPQPGAEAQRLAATQINAEIARRGLLGGTGGTAETGDGGQEVKK